MAVLFCPPLRDDRVDVFVWMINSKVLQPCCLLPVSTNKRMEAEEIRWQFESKTCTREERFMLYGTKLRER